MSRPEPITEAESAALGNLIQMEGALAAYDACLLEAYRAGFSDGRQPPEPRVFREGDPEPGHEVMAVLDYDNDVWWRDGDSRYWSCNGDHKLWDELLRFCPLVSCPQLPDHMAVVEADRQRSNAASESAGGDQ